MKKTAGIPKCFGWFLHLRWKCMHDCGVRARCEEVEFGSLEGCVYVVEEDGGGDCFGHYGPQRECGSCDHEDHCREAAYAERWRRKTAFIPPFDGVVVVVDEHDSRYACFGNDENFCLKGDKCPMYAECCRVAGFVGEGNVVILEEDLPTPCVGRVREGSCTWTDVCPDVGACHAVAYGAVEVSEENE